MSNFTYAFILSSLAGLSTLIGLIPIFFKLKDKNKVINCALSFASGVMICVSVTDLIRESYSLLSTIFIPFPALILLLIFLVSGIILSMLIDKFLPNNNQFISNQKLYRLGIVSMLAIIMHNIPEDCSCYVSR